MVEEARAKAWPNGYAIRSGQYCDGAAFFPHSGGALTVLGVTQGDTPAPMPPGALIPIRTAGAFGAAAPGNAVVKLMGRDREAGGTWRLDGVLPPKGLEVDPKAALEPLGMAFDRVAIRAQIDLDGEKWDVPVRVGNATGDQLAVWLRSPQALATVSLAILDPAGAPGISKASVVTSNVPANRAFAVKLPNSLKPGKRTILTVVGDGGGRPGTNILTARIPMIVPISP